MAAIDFIPMTAASKTLRNMEAVMKLMTATKHEIPKGAARTS